MVPALQCFVYQFACPQRDDKMENLEAELSKHKDQVRRLEAKLDEYSAMLKEAVKSKERLQITLEKHEQGRCYDECGCQEGQRDKGFFALPYPRSHPLRKR